MLMMLAKGKITFTAPSQPQPQLFLTDQSKSRHAFTAAKGHNLMHTIPMKAVEKREHAFGHRELHQHLRHHNGSLHA
jgi:hypothetical protein